MSWLGSGFSQIRGQISDFTKEVLTETTEEIDDPATQLHLSRRRISELETWVSSQQAENKRLQHENAELVDKLESAELQISAVSKEYRAIVDTKEVSLTELKQLREQHQDRSLDLSPDIYSSSHSAAILPHSSSAPALLFAEPGDEDFDDVIACQREINQLRSEVQRLNAEVRHWKKCVSLMSYWRCVDVASLPVAISSSFVCSQELTEQVRDEVDQHQRELAALQDVHAQKIATLQSQHRAQISAAHDQSETGEHPPPPPEEQRLMSIVDVNIVLC
ncbi:hypothetical protein CAPTEDRAFT_141522 [Capitella teleta]|uniref:Uncharacterized protein n=1 Tax=Capitella teleta TaxID=283909 RepID=R7UWC4_CAPTE|nr:hypothetical protein CAPTEDRAFT_141522 [Capitella teleta]|eukprot:ELU10619.1 hypothetical protein CAPTEDRAFT_141522 [Capitella teleta]